MATSHYCNGKWRDGTVAACPKHKGLSKKQTSVYRSPDKDDKDQAASASDSSSGDSGSTSGDSGSSSD